MTTMISSAFNTTHDGGAFVYSNNNNGATTTTVPRQEKQQHDWLLPQEEEEEGGWSSRRQQEELASRRQQQQQERTTLQPQQLRYIAQQSAADEDDLYESTTTNDDNKNDDVARARWLLLGSAALYGTNFALVKLMNTEMSVGVSTTLRFGMAALATLPWLFLPPKSNNENEKAALAATLAGLEVGAYNSIGYVAQAIGLDETTPASESAFLCSLAVVVVPLLDKVFGIRQLQWNQTLGILLAIFGVAVLELLGGGGGTGAGAGADADAGGGLLLAAVSAPHSFFSSLEFGDVCSLIQPLAFGVGFWRMEHAMSQYPQHANRSTAAQLLAVFLASAVYSVVVGDNCGGGDATSSSAWSVPYVTSLLSNPTVLLELFWTGVITTALTVYMETCALKTLSAAETTLIFSTEPLWGTAFAAAVMGESFGLHSALGAVLILTGCVVSNLKINGEGAAGTTTSSRRRRHGGAAARQMAASSSVHPAAAGGGGVLLAKGCCWLTDATNQASVAAKVAALEAQAILQGIVSSLSSS